MIRIDRRSFALLVGSVMLAWCALPVRAGTTGSVSGRTFDSATNAPLANAAVSAVSPTQTASGTTDAAGGFAFVSLAPDTYVVTAKHVGYDTYVVRGITVLADQSQTLSIPMVKSLATLGRVVVHAANELVKAGTTSDVYSINASAALAASAVGGPGNLNQAYAAMASVPGVNLPQGQQGWYQPVYIRGGDLDQVGWEFDGIPVNRSYDNAPMTFLSNLGQQELQVYTGGTLATSDASSISGYVNQVIRKGTYPGYADLHLAIGAPTFYNKASLEIGGSTPDQRFTYFMGTIVDDSNYRYIDQNNGVNAGGFFYPLNCCQTTSGFWDGGATAAFAAVPGQSYAIANTRDRESIGNFHFALPHGDGPPDDIQLLYLTAELFTYYYSSVNDLGGPRYVYDNTNCPVTFPCPGAGFPINWQDGVVYTGQVFSTFNAPQVVNYFYPSRPLNQFTLPLNNRDANDNGIGLYKVQYQHNFSSKAYLRVFGYGLYSTWYIDGPLSAFLPFGAEIADYENWMHNFGGALQYANQLSDKHLLTVGAFYTSGHSYRYSTTSGFPSCTLDCAGTGGQTSFITNLIDATGNCYNAAGNLDTCFSTANRGRFPQTGGSAMPYPAVGAALAAGAQWIVTSNGYHANVNDTKPRFSALSFNDDFKPDDRWTFNIGLRVENYRVDYPDVNTAYPARPFWFAAYNREFCFGPDVLMGVARGFTAGVLNACPAAPYLASNLGMTPVNVTNPGGGGSFSHTVWQPRFGTTFSANSNDVFRLSAGLYARPASTREASWSTAEQNLPFLLGSDFLQYGFSTPEHDVRPDRSTNFDLSWEHRFPGTQVSFKVTPFYRSTQDQLQQLIVNALTGLFASFNAGHQISDGVELALNAGDFSNNGLAAKFAYTHTHSRIKYQAFANGRNVIDNLNTYIQTYNRFTSACAGGSTSPLCSSTGNTSTVAFPCFTGGVGHNQVGPCPVGDVTNPYFNSPQPLLDPNGWYTTYDLIPAPFAAANGFETPDTATLILNFKANKWSFTPSLVYSSGAKYGSPVIWPGYDPSSCAAAAGTNMANTTTCTTSIFIPDAYTGKFDNLGAFNQPQRYTVNLQIGYAATPAVDYTLTVNNIVDTCIQRGYAWDYQHMCAYSALPSSILAPVGNFANPATAPADLRFPYAVWLNNNNTGFIGTTLPLQAAFEVHVRL